MTIRIKPRALVPFLILAASLLGFFALYATRPQGAPVQPDEKMWPVSLETVQVSNLQPHLTLYGRVETPRDAKLTAAIAGDIQQLPVREGQDVAADDLLAVIDDSDYRLALAQREAELAEVEAEIESEKARHQTNLASLEHERSLLNLSRRAVKRAKDLADTSVGSQAQLDEARQAEERQALAIAERKLSIREHGIRMAQLEARRAKTRALRDRALLDVQRTRIRAPFAGRISETHVAPGDRVRSGDPLLAIYDAGELEIRAQIPTRYVDMVSQALSAGERLPITATIGERTVSAELDRLAGQVRRGSGGLDGLFRVTGGSDVLQMGRTLELLMTLPSQRAVVALPQEAVYGMDRVYKVVDGRMQGVLVERVGDVRSSTGERRVLVRSPALASGTEVVTTQLPNAIDGLRVQASQHATPSTGNTALTATAP
ncbi:MAG: biotin/lipoyl-binding protein [Gammaproteobacteria bacterium]|nr:biotin/lipoyl-binding protein [Gammaproteobacteria bacterium]